MCNYNELYRYGMVETAPTRYKLNRYKYVTYGDRYDDWVRLYEQKILPCELGERPTYQRLYNIVRDIRFPSGNRFKILDKTLTVTQGWFELNMSRGTYSIINSEMCMTSELPLPDTIGQVVDDILRMNMDVFILNKNSQKICNDES